MEGKMLGIKHLLVYVISLISCAQAVSPLYLYETHASHIYAHPRTLSRWNSLPPRESSLTFHQSPPSFPHSTSPSGSEAPSPSPYEALPPSPEDTYDHENIFNVLNHGAAGNGYSDDTQAFIDAWETACSASNSSGIPTILVPFGRNYSLNTVAFRGPCKSKNIHVQMHGFIVGPSNSSKWNCRGAHSQREWIVFQNVHGLTIAGRGHGIINGGGDTWWNPKKRPCKEAPGALAITQCSNVTISGLMFVDNPGFHVKLDKSTLVNVNGLSIIAPGDSPNTDGIHIENAEYVHIDDCFIGTGDDCISIGSGNANIMITNITCGPGHGISIGSLGKGGRNSTVANVYVKNVVLSGTTNGIRIKSWQGGKGYARNITYEDIYLKDAENPIIIDQYYCPNMHHNCTNQTSAVHISDVKYKGVYGTSARKLAVIFACSESTACTNIFMGTVNITWAEHEEPTTSYCLNAKGKIAGNVFPAVPCLDP